MSITGYGYGQCAATGEQAHPEVCGGLESERIKGGFLTSGQVRCGGTRPDGDYAYAQRQLEHRLHGENYQYRCLES